MKDNKNITILILTERKNPYIIHTLESICSQKTKYDFHIAVLCCSFLDDTARQIKKYQEIYGRNINCFSRESGFLFERVAHIISVQDTDYFTILPPHFWYIDDKFLEDAVDFLEHCEQYSSYGCNTELFHQDDMSTIMLYNSVQETIGQSYYYSEYTTYSIGDYFCDLMIIPETIIYRNYFFLLQNQAEFIELLNDIDWEDSMVLNESLFMMNLKYGMAKYVEISAGRRLMTQRNKTEFVYLKENILKLHLMAEWYDVPIRGQFLSREIELKSSMMKLTDRILNSDLEEKEKSDQLKDIIKLCDGIECLVTEIKLENYILYKEEQLELKEKIDWRELYELD